MGKWGNRALAQKGNLLGVQMELERSNLLLHEIVLELQEANRLSRLATDGPAWTRR